MWFHQLIVASLLALSAANRVRYMVISPQTLRPGMLYNLAVMVTSDDLQQVTVHASILCGDRVVAESAAEVPANTLGMLPVKVVMAISPGTYTINVEVKNKGMLLFHNSSQLTFEPRFLSIVVQTSRPIYRSGQEVLFRVVALQRDLQPFNDGLEVYVLDPDGIVMRRWVSAYTNNGVSSLRFKLPKLAKDGFWKIRVKAWDQIEEQLIRVETYFDPLFEVHVKLPPYISKREKFITGSVCGLSLTQRMVEGNGTLTLLARKIGNNEDFEVLWTENVFFKAEEHHVQIPMDIISLKFGSLDGLELKLHASITELLSLETVEGFSLSRLKSGDLQLRFLNQSPAKFKPGFPFYSHIAVFYDGYEKVPLEVLKSSRIRIQVELEDNGGQKTRLPDIIAGSGYESLWDNVENFISDQSKEQFVDELSHEEYLEEGVLRFSFDSLNDTKKIIIKALFVSEDGTNLESTLEAVSYFSPTRKFISVTSSSRNLKADEFAIFHIKSNVRMESFQYIVVSKSEMVTSGELAADALTTSTLALGLSREMAPGFRLIVFHITADGEILTDSCFVPVDGFHKYNTELEVNTGKDHKAERVEARVSGGAGAFIGVQAVRAPAYTLQGGNEISLARVVQRLMLLENSASRKFNKMQWKSGDGTDTDKIRYYMSMDEGYDTSHSFKSAGLNVFTSEDIQLEFASELCDPETEMACDASSCFPTNKTCDGVVDCLSGYDEFMCPGTEEEEYKYKITRMSRSEFLFDMREGDWGWREIKVNDHEGVEFEPMTAPQTADDWYFTAFSINNDYGFSIIPAPVVFSSRRNLMMHVTGPESCRAGEQLGLQLNLFNHHHLEALVIVTLLGSADYRFVHVEEGGSVSSYSARLSSGDHQLLVYIPPESQEHIDLPVVPTVQQGEIVITVVATAQIGLCEKTHTVTVHGGGALINKHTSVFLDLKNRALVMSYLDIVVEETPIIPYNMTRRYVFGSTSATIELFGDIIGPAFSTVPATVESTLKTSSKGTLARVFEFGINIWTLHYLRLTNKLQRSFLKEVLFECNAIYAQIMKRFNKTGYFSNWDSSGPSIWLTAWVLRLLKAAAYPDWEFMLFLDPSIADRSVSWLLSFQAPNGSFVDVSTDIDSKLNTQSGQVSLTAHALISLCDCMSLLSGELKTRAAVASGRAAAYLERLLGSVSDPHALAMSVYALTVSMGRGDVQLGYHRLMKAQQTNSEGFIYWSPREVPANPIKKENQRPYVVPRVYREQDSVAVETTAWVLLVLLHREGVTDTSERIVKWLNSMRMTSAGFISTVDTLVALQALTEFAFRARLHEVTNMEVTVELPMSANQRVKVHIDNSSVLFQTQMPIPKVWGNVVIMAQGAGQALAQMDVNYGIDNEAFVEVPTEPCFGLNVTEYYSTLRNKSAITVHACLRWTRSDPPASSAATLEIDSPTGYMLVESEAETVAQVSHPTLRDALITPTRNYWFFEKVERHWTCFNYTLRRWFPVANMTLHRQALLYEATARERFVQIVFNSTPLHVLDICEVCGSYQCPYCPHYNTASSHPSLLVTTLVSLTMLLCAI